jgi:predicted kinase
LPSEVAVLVGLPGSGKTTFYHQRLSATHAHVSKDLMPNVRRRDLRQLAQVEEALAAGRSVAVDNTNPARADRAALIAAARARGARVVAYLMLTPVRDALQRNRGRQGKERVPDVAVFVTAKKLQPPTVDEGFDEVFHVSAEGGEFKVQPALL